MASYLSRLVKKTTGDPFENPTYFANLVASDETRIVEERQLAVLMIVQVGKKFRANKNLGRLND